MTAKKEFGGIEQTKEVYRGARGLPFLETLLQDLRYGLRALVKKPGFALVAILTLALGIGATSAVFSVVDRILFRSLPYPQDDRLVSFGYMAPLDSLEFFLGTDYVEWRAKQTPFAAMTSMTPGVANCDLTDQSPVRLGCAHVEYTLLPTLGIQPILGRNFTREEDRPRAPQVVLLSYGLWRSRFGGDPGAVGKRISLDGQPVLIVGVLPSNFELPTLGSADILLPQALDEAAQVRPNTGRFLRTFARLKPGVTAAQAQAALQPLFQDSLQFVPASFRKEVSLRVRSLRDRQIHDARLASWILLGAVLAVLLLASANVANLLLARAANRQQELAVRAALGATRSRLIRQMLTESLLLGALGGAAGCGLAGWLLGMFVSIAPDGIPRLQQAGVDGRVLSFTLVVSLVSGILFGLVPALRSPGSDFLTGRQGQTFTRSMLRQSLVAAQIAMSVVLLAGAGLLLRSLWNLQNVSLGMQTENILTARIVLGRQRYPDGAQQQNFFEQLEARLGRLPGVSSLALSDTLPPAGGMRSAIYANIEIAGRPRFAEGTGGLVGWRIISPGYFSVLGIPILRGHAFQAEDRSPNENSIILSESLARRLFPNENSLGKRIRFALQGPWWTVIGVVGNVKNNGLADDGGPEFYAPLKHQPESFSSSASLLLRSPVNPQAVASWIRAEISSLDPTLPVEIETMSQRVGKLTQRPRFNAALLSLFAAMGVGLAAIGIYGVVAFLVAQRTREIGVRMALGATPRTILRMVLGHVLRWTSAGAILGLLGAWFATRLLQSLLFHVAAHDPLLLGTALVLLLMAAFLAAWIPARRAMRVDPMVALRYE